MELKDLVPPQLDELCNSQLEDWLEEKHHLRAEIVFSMFDKKWFVNNYFVDTKKGKKVYPKDEIKFRSFVRKEVQEVALIELFKLI